MDTAILAAREEYKIALLEEYEVQQNLMTETSDWFSTIGVIVTKDPVDANGTPIRVFKRLGVQTTNFFQSSLLSTAVTLSLSRAQVLLPSGYASLGQYGVTCPVNALTGRSVAVPFHPVLFRQKLYFPENVQKQKIVMDQTHAFCRVFAKRMGPRWFPNECS